GGYACRESVEWNACPMAGVAGRRQSQSSACTCKERMTAEKSWFRFGCHSTVAVVQTSAALRTEFGNTFAPIAQACGAGYYTHVFENQNEINHRRDGRSHRSRQDCVRTRLDRHRR